MLDIIIHEEDPNQNHSEILLQIQGDGYTKNDR